MNSDEQAYRLINRLDEWKPFELYDICAVYLGEQP